jgi:hypothetical protein
MLFEPFDCVRPLGVLLVQVIVFVPSVVECPSASSAIAVSLNVPLPRLGKPTAST